MGARRWPIREEHVLTAYTLVGLGGAVGVSGKLVSKD